MPIKAEELTSLQIADSGDYRALWQTILDAKKDGTPYVIPGSREWPVEVLERVRAAMRGRRRRAGLPWQLHLLRGPGLYFLWTVPRVAPGEERNAASERQYCDAAIASGSKKARHYRKRSPCWQERLEIKKARRQADDFWRRDPDEPPPTAAELWEG